MAAPPAAPVFDIAVARVSAAFFLGGHLCRRFSVQIFLPPRRAAPRHSAHRHLSGCDFLCFRKKSYSENSELRCEKNRLLAIESHPLSEKKNLCSLFSSRFSLCVLGGQSFFAHPHPKSHKIHYT